jgi:hypothetical protein
MAKSLSTLERLTARVEEQALDVANLRVALAVQFNRIAQMQSELDGLPWARKRRQSLLKLMTHAPSHNGRH